MIMQPQTLATVSERTLSRITGYQTERGLKQRLIALGLFPGAEVTTMQRRGGGLVVARGSDRIALGGAIAAQILVESLA